MAFSDPIVTFTRKHPHTGQTQTRDAYTPAEAVSLRADGWVEKASGKSTSTTTSASAAAGGKSTSS